MDAVLVYNLTKNPDRDFQHQLDAMARAFRRAGINMCPVDNAEAYDYVQKYLAYVSFVYMWDHDYSLAEEIEALNVPVINASRSIRLASDKASLFHMLKRFKVPIPRFLNVPFLAGEDPTKHFEKIETAVLDAGIEYPFLIRERFFANQEKQYLVTSSLNFRKVLSVFAHEPLIVQEVLSKLLTGPSFRLYVVGKRIAAAVELFHQGNARVDVIKNEVMASVTGIDRGLKHLAISAARAVGATFAAVDVSFNARGRALVTNVETAPYTFLADQVAKCDIDLILARHLKRHWKEARLALL